MTDEYKEIVSKFNKERKNNLYLFKASNGIEFLDAANSIYQPNVKYFMIILPEDKGTGKGYNVHYWMDENYKRLSITHDIKDLPLTKEQGQEIFERLKIAIDELFNKAINQFQILLNRKNN